MKNIQLPNRPIPYSDETAASILIRAAEVNGHVSVYQLLSGMRVKINESALIACLIDPPRYQRIIRALGLGDDAAARPLDRVGSSKHAPRRYRSVAIPAFAFRRDDARVFCPQCLADSPYWRQQWLIRPLAVCTKHHRLLLDRCLNCGNELSVGRGELSHCNRCRAYLPDMRGPIVNIEPQLAIEQMIEDVKVGSLNDFFAFWHALVRFDGEDNNPAAEYRRVEIVYSFFSRDGEAEKFIARCVEERLTLLHPRIQMMPFLTGSQAMSLFAKKILDTVLPLPAVGAGDFRFSHLRAKEVCAILNVSITALSALIRDGFLEWPVNGSGGREQRIATTQIESLLQRGWLTPDGIDLDRVYLTKSNAQPVADKELIESLTRGMSFKQVSEHLGVSERQVGLLLRKGVLRRISKRDYPTLIDRESLWKLMRTFRRPDLLPIQVAADILGHSIAWLRANWIGNGIVTLHDYELWQFVPKVEIEMVERIRKKYMTMTEACRALGVHQDRIISLEKFLTPFKFGKNRGLRLYERTAIRAFVKTYGRGMSLSDVTVTIRDHVAAESQARGRAPI